MVARNRARYLAPIALAATVAATYVIVQDALETKTTTVRSQTVRRPASGTTRPTAPSPRAQFYTVRPGDTLSGISARTGVALPTLEQLNPGVNPGGLQAGQRLRLRR